MTESTVTTREFRLAEENLEAAEAWLAKTNRKATRLGLKPYAWAITGRETEPIFADALDYDAGPRRIVGYRHWVDLAVYGEVPRINGWTFIAGIDNDPEVGITTRVVPGLADADTLDLTEFRNEDRVGTCDHCQTQRYRRRIYVLRNTEALAVAADRTWGFTSRSAAGNGKEATIDLIHRFIRPFNQKDRDATAPLGAKLNELGETVQPVVDGLTFTLAPTPCP